MSNAVVQECYWTQKICGKHSRHCIVNAWPSVGQVKRSRGTENAYYAEIVIVFACK